MENKIAELENRIKKLEAILERIDFTGNALNITFNHASPYAVKISGDGANVDFKHCPIGFVSNDGADDIEDLEDLADELECRVDDIKCAAEDVKALLDDIEPRFSALSEKINKLDTDGEK